MISLALFALLGLTQAVPSEYNNECYKNGQFLVNKHDKCSYLVCDYGKEPWFDSYGRIRYATKTQYCPHGTAVNIYHFNPYNPCSDSSSDCSKPSYHSGYQPSYHPTHQQSYQSGYQQPHQAPSYQGSYHPGQQNSYHQSSYGAAPSYGYGQQTGYGGNQNSYSPHGSGYLNSNFQYPRGYDYSQNTGYSNNIH